MMNMKILKIALMAMIKVVELTVARHAFSRDKKIQHRALLDVTHSFLVRAQS